MDENMTQVEAHNTGQNQTLQPALAIGRRGTER